MGLSRSPCSSRAVVGRRLASEPLPNVPGPREIAQRFHGVAATQPGADPSDAQQSVGLRDRPQSMGYSHGNRTRRRRRQPGPGLANASISRIPLRDQRDGDATNCAGTSPIA